MADLCKKRKFLCVELDFPDAKHKCLESDCHDMITAQDEGEALASASLHASLVESAKDSNSFPDEADTAASPFVDVGWVYGHAVGRDGASTSSTKWPACDYLQEMDDMSDAERELNPETSCRRFSAFFSNRGESPRECGLQMRQMLEEQLLEFGVDLGYGCSEYADECQGQPVNKEVESSDCMLLSGRSGVTEEPTNGAKKPTIDQEFEEYFSTLMM